MPLGFKSLSPSPVSGTFSSAPKSGIAGSGVRLDREAACSGGTGGGPSSRISKNAGEFRRGTRMLQEGVIVG
jgi:hypothetical protein